MNSAAAIHVAQPELALMPAFEKAQRILDSGQALAKLTEFVKLTNSDVNVA